DNETVRKTNLGCFTQEELSDIWKDSEYQDMQDELLQLMMRFKLCYQIPNRPGNYIAPQLLDYENLPEYNWDKSNNLILRYKYDFMPKGMLTRFIVETHPWIEQQKIVWKSGVVLNKDETRAEVIESYNRREIKVRVAGNRKKDLITVVNHELEKNHRSYERLEYKTLVPCNCSDCIGSENPYTYALENLRRRLEKGRKEIECDRSFEMVNVRRLIDDVNLSPQREEFQEYQVKSTPLQRELEIERELNLNVRNQNQVEYQEFQILVDKNNQIRVSSSQGDESGQLNLDINKMNLSLKLIESGQTNKDLLKALGSELYQALFPNQINARFHATISSAQAKQESVRLRLIFESPQLASLPWEFLYDEGTNTFLGNNTETVLSRYIDVPLEKREIKSASLPLKVLLVISSPSNLNKLDATGEENLIREALKKQIETNKIELDVLTEATTSNIRQKLREKSYNVFHFIGHGEFKDNQGHICLVDEYGKSKSLDDENFANFFLGNNHLGLVILNCCKSGTISSNKTFAGTVSNLVRRGIPAAVAMQYTILDSTAKLFTSEFYKTLALGFPVDRAIQSTRNAISQDVGLGKPDFATPVLYMRAKDGIILNGL
ncbi:MAG: COR domain-containing protein, partial [Cyanobacteriota bacterium]|nr:COR domain-containing protein [Cyanobacteriota bacterium]